MARVIFENAIVTRETDPNPINDTWTIDVHVLPVTAGFQVLVNRGAGNQGVDLLGGQTVTYGPAALGLKNQRYDIQILIRGRELDPANENRGNDDVPPGGVMQLEYRSMLCPSDRQMRYKVKQDFVDPANPNEKGQIEYTFRIDLDP